MSQNATVLVGILMGSERDYDVMKKASVILKEFGVAHEMRVLSAHRMPEDVAQYVRSARDRGIKTIIAGAGLAAHLAGAVAANTALPVIGVPIGTGPLAGQDSLLATVQMPSGMPVATVGIDNASNAGLLAVQILAVTDDGLYQKLLARREKERETLRSKVLPLA